MPTNAMTQMTLEEINTGRIEFFAKAHRLAFNHYIRSGHVPDVLTKIMEETSSLPVFLNTLRKFNPYHKPAGTPEGGEFDFAPGSGDGDLPDEPGLGRPFVVEALMGLSLFGVRTAIGIVAGLAEAIGVNIRIVRAARAIEKYLEGRPDRIFRNNADDLIIMRGDRKIRFDINNYKPHKEPHFHIQKETANGQWESATDKHLYEFRKE